MPRSERVSLTINRVEIMGRLGSDPEVRYTASGVAVATLKIATEEKIKGEKKTEWHKVTAWAKQAEFAGKYLAKGDCVLVEGRIETQMWEKDGVKHYDKVIQAWSVKKVAWAVDEDQGGGYQEPEGGAPIPEGDIPF